jgi:hypothetical protein
MNAKQTCRITPSLYRARTTGATSKAGQYEYWMEEYSEPYVSFPPPKGSGGYLLACFNLRIFLVS